MDSAQAIQQALKHHQAGRLGEAEAIYRKILQSDPRNADALHLLGALAGQCGNRDAAIDLIRQAIAHRPNYPDALRNLGALLAQADRYEEAVGVYQKVVAIWPNRADVLNDYGSVLLHENRLEEAIAVLSKATLMQPGLADAHRHVGSALRKQGKVEEALAASGRAVELKPMGAEGHFEHALNLTAAGRGDEAIGEYRKAIELKADFEEAHLNLGRALADQGKFDEAIDVFINAVRMKPDSATLHFNLGQMLRLEDRQEEAIESYRTAVRIKPDYADAHGQLAVTLTLMQRIEEAEASYDQAVRYAPGLAVTYQAKGEIALQKLDGILAAQQFRRWAELDANNPDAWLRLGSALQSTGKFDEAASCFRRAVEVSPTTLRAYQRLAASGRQVVEDADAKKITEALNQPQVLAEERAAAEFALGKAADEADRFDEAFAHYAIANSTVRALRALDGQIYSPEGFHQWAEETMATFNPAFFAARREWGDSSEIPVFVVGMPRSGTTLVHQICASHPEVHGAGELSEVQKLAEQMGGNSAKDVALGWQPEKMRSAAQQYLQRVCALNATAARIIDKLPTNVHFLSFIAVMFPKARVIFCRRDPRDNCLSCYFQNFTGSIYAFDLTDCGHQQVETSRLMDHWLQVLPIPMLEIRYESLVADLEGQSRRLINFLGLPWDPACLEFHQAETAVITFSVWQVRQPIYTRSVGRWRNYERHLGPLLEALGDLPARYESSLNQNRR